VHREIVDEDDEACIRAVLDMWALLPDLRAELSLIIIVAMIYAEEQQGFYVSVPITNCIGA
jgi:hypothetical protein